LLGQLVLEGDAMAGRPLAGKNSAFNIFEDAPVQRRFLALSKRFDPVIRR
jgi:hypothetical protein